MKEFINISCFVLVLLLVLQFGYDLSNHMQMTRLFWRMISEKKVFLTNPEIGGGNQLTFNYGIPAYLVSGLLFPWLGKNTIDFLLACLLTIGYILLKSWFKKEEAVTLSIAMASFAILTDSYVFMFATILFWSGSFAFYKKKKIGWVLIALSCLTHPYAILPSMFFVSKNKKFLIPLATILAYTIIIFLQTKSEVSTFLLIPVVASPRIISLIMPILSGSYYEKTDKQIHDLIKGINLSLPASITIMALACVITAITCLNILPSFANQEIQFSDRIINGFPDIKGRVRVVDYLQLPMLYKLHKKDLVIIEGSFRENNNQHIIDKFWDSEKDYQDFIRKIKADYVLFCKKCNPKSNELYYITNFPKVWENEYYTLYNTSPAYPM